MIFRRLIKNSPERIKEMETSARIKRECDCLEDFLFHCMEKSGGYEPWFERSDAIFLYDLIGVSLEKMYGGTGKIPELVLIPQDEMDCVLERIFKRNPNVIYN